MKDLTELFASLFSSEEIRRFIRDLPQHGALLYRELPGVEASLNKHASGAVDALHYHGLVNEALFEHLLKERPARRDDIERIQALVATEMASVPQPRRDYLQYILDMEQERQPLTDILTDLPGATQVSLDDVYIPPRLRMPNSLASVADSNEGAGILFDDWMVDVIDRHRETRLVILIGEMGRGKTELIHRALRRFAERALGDWNAPLPLLLRARDFAASPSGVEGICKAAGDAQSLVSLLFDNASTRWIYLVDGLDEAPSIVRERLRSLILLPTFRADLVIATSRPPEPLQSKAAVFALAPWTEAHVNNFLDHWQHSDASAVDALRRLRVAAPGIDELLRNPLTATLCLLVAGRMRARQLSRAVLWTEMIEHLVEDWLGKRGIEDSPEQILRVLEDISLHHIANRQPAVERAILMNALRPAAPNAARALEKHVGRALGLLVERSDSSYDFLFRGLAEHLAGRALFRRGTKAVVKVAYEVWAEEPVRHAIGYAAAVGRSMECRRMLSLLLGQCVLQGHRGIHYLRPLLIAIRAAADVGEIAAPLARRFTVIIAGLLSEESSAWLGDHVADAVQVLAGTGGSLAKQLWEQCRALLITSPSSYQPIHWYAARADLAVEDLLDGLYHRDTHVRALVCMRLAAHVNLPEVQQHLFLMCLDQDWSSLHPALLAGLALRQAPRDSTFVDTLEALQDMLGWRSQIASGAAALALHPHEADVRELASALMAIVSTNADGYLATTQVYELAEAPGGAAALDAAWPDWREHLKGREGQESILSRLSLGAASIPMPPMPPPSAHVRRRILRAFGPGLHDIAPAEVPDFDRHEMYKILRDLCRAAYDYPEKVLPHLQLDSRMQPMPTQAEIELGQAAVRHTIIRDALISAWSKNPHARRVLGVYPGLALEPLVLQGDAQAIDTYAQWLRVSPHTWPFSDFPAPDPLFFKIPLIREAAYKRVWDHWRYASRGRIKGGKRQWLAPTTLAITMRLFWPAWSGDEQLLAGLQRWMRSPKTERVLGAMQALSGGPLPAHLAEIFDTVLVDRLSLCLSAPQAHSSHYQRDWLHLLAHRLPQALHLHVKAIGLLSSMAASGGPMSPLAAGLLLPLLSDDAQRRELSAQVAPIGVTLPPYYLDAAYLRTLVEASPEAWAAAARDHLDPDELPNVHVVMRILQLLDPKLRAELARALHQVASEWELPWMRVTDAFGIERCARPSDIAEQVLFDTGLAIEIDDPSDGTSMA